MPTEGGKRQSHGQHDCGQHMETVTVTYFLRVKTYNYMVSMVVDSR